MAWWFGGAKKEIEILATEEEKENLRKFRHGERRSLKIRLKKTILRILKKYPRFYKKQYSLREIWVNQ